MIKHAIGNYAKSPLESIMRHTLTVNLGNLVLSLSDAMDLASPLLTRHQQRTAYTVWQMGELAGISKETLEQCFIAALLHDIGALSLDEKIALQNFEVQDTERLDGSGYPFHCTEKELSTGARIMMVADIFTALAEDRPYRKGMTRKGIFQIIKQFSDRNLLDSRIATLLFENYEEIYL
jgi:HD-GYP domain-containing protein (c-di-GMP phosphodiesterase class II)